MFQIEYSFADNFKESKYLNLAEADDFVLAYDIFLGDILYKTKYAVINMQWQWIPLVDFAYCTRDICEKLKVKNHGIEAFEFTESEATITYIKNDERVGIVASFSDVRLEIDFPEFEVSVNQFYTAMIQAVQERYPELRSNPNFRKYSDVTG